MGEGDDDGGGGGVSRNNMYQGNGEELVLASLSNSYLELEAIFISASRLSSCPTLYYLLTVTNLRS